MENVSYKKSQFSDGELQEIAGLHQRWIPSGFLTSLGSEFLARMYASIAESPAGVLIAAKDPDNKVVGFISGTTSIRSIYQHLVSHHFVFLVLLVLKFVFSVKTLIRILEDKQYSTQDHPGAENISAELLSIVVDERLRGEGIAPGLFKELSGAFREKGVEKFKIIVGSQLIQAQKFYLKTGAVKVAEIELHHGQRSFVYQSAV